MHIERPQGNVHRTQERERRQRDKTKTKKLQKYVTVTGFWVTPTAKSLTFQLVDIFKQYLVIQDVLCKQFHHVRAAVDSGDSEGVSPLRSFQTGSLSSYVDVICSSAPLSYINLR